MLSEDALTDPYMSFSGDAFAVADRDPSSPGAEFVLVATTNGDSQPILNGVVAVIGGSEFVVAEDGISAPGSAGTLDIFINSFPQINSAGDIVFVAVNDIPAIGFGVYACLECDASTPLVSVIEGGDILDAGAGEMLTVLNIQSSPSWYSDDTITASRFQNPLNDNRTLLVRLDGDITNVTGAPEEVVLYAVNFFTPATVSCNAADIAPPLGQLDLSDVQTFLIGFGNMDPIADISPPGGDGVFNLSDVQDFLIAFGAGCP